MNGTYSNRPPWYLPAFTPGRGHKVDIPTCDVCGRLVDGFHQWLDDRRQEWHLIAVCHGDTEEVVLTVEFLQAHKELNTGRAFVRPVLVVGRARGFDGAPLMNRPALPPKGSE